MGPAEVGWQGVEEDEHDFVGLIYAPSPTPNLSLTSSLLFHFYSFLSPYIALHYITYIRINLQYLQKYN